MTHSTVCSVPSSRYHGDFDWAGIAIANDLVQAFEVQPWRMAASDYLSIPAQLGWSGAGSTPSGTASSHPPWRIGA